MKLTVNGETLETSAATLKELLNQLSVLPGRVAVEVNLSVVKKADYPSFALKDGDVIEIVNFVGGGSSAILARREKGVRCLNAHVT
jgi:thiamine biosynthesis protein ThiS